MMTLYLDDVLKAIGEPDAVFPIFMRCNPIETQPDEPDFSETNVRNAAQLTDCDDEATARLCAAASFLRNNEMFRLAALCMYRCLFQFREDGYVRFSRVEQQLGESIRMLIRTLSAFAVKRWHTEQNIPEDISRATLRYLRASRNNFTGCFPDAAAYSWLRQLLYPELMYLHIVRFGFAIAPRPWNSITFRHENGSFLSLAKPDVYVDANGIPLTKDEYEQEGGTKTVFRIENGKITGHIIAENGRISTNTEQIPADGYSLYLKDGMPVINMHIPGGGGMTPDLVLQSWHCAKDFYSKRLGPDCPKVIACGSWTCSPELDEIVPPGSNLARFVNFFRRLPNEACPQSLKHFIHPGTSLARAFDAYFEKGGRFREGSMFLPLDEIN